MAKGASAWRLHVAVSTAIGIAIAGGLVAANDGAEIWRVLSGAGWGIALVLAIHPVQTLLAGMAWRAVLPTAADRRAPPGFWTFALLRWIREAVNALLPVAQIGGELVGARLMALKGAALNGAVAATAVDLTLEMLSQVVFTLFGVGLLVSGPYDPAAARWVGGAAAVALVIAAAFVAAQRRWLFRLLERGLLRLAEKPRWSALGELAGLHEQVAALYRQPRRLLKGGFWHLLSWIGGGVEVMVALRVVGVEVSFDQALLIESIGQAMRTAGFAIPGSLGVQEGGFILVCAWVGVSAESAIAMSLLKRMREVVAGVPGLIAWQMIEGRRLARPAADPPAEPS